MKFKVTEKNPKRFKVTESDQSWEIYWKGKSAFWFDYIDFTTNQLIDKSGNANHVAMVNASARTGNGVNLDYLITGLLMTDTITIEVGSNIPTIPVNGILRIGAAQIVYGVTIRRAGIIWAIIPFCEENIWDLPTTSYDVSGNFHHATCAGLAAGNITTQNTYFYLQRYGYSTHGTDLLGWNFNSWSGVFPNERFSGAAFPDASSVNLYISNAGGGRCLYRQKVAAGIADFKLRETLVHSAAGWYRADMNVISYACNTGNLNGIHGLWPPFNVATDRQVRNSIGLWSVTYFIPGAGNFELNRAYGTNDLDIVFDFVKLYKMGIVPGMLSLNGKDALNNDIEFASSIHKFLMYGCQLLFPVILQTITFNYGVGVLIKSGFLSPLYKYKIVTSTLPNHFGAGKIAGDVITGVATILCSYEPENHVRQVYNYNIFNAVVSYNDLNFYRRELYYTDKNYKNLANYTKSAPDDHLQEGSWGDQDLGYLTQLIILKKNITYDHDYLINTYNVPETCDMGIIAYVWDAFYDANIIQLETILFANGAKSTYCVYIGEYNSYSIMQFLIASKNDLQKHTPGFLNHTIPSWKGFHEDIGNYIAAQLDTYYADTIQWFITYFNQARIHSVMPGGAYDSQQLGLTKNHFASAMTVGSCKYNTVPLYKNTRHNPLNDATGQYVDNYSLWYRLSRGNFWVPAAWRLAEIAANKGFQVLYCHPYNEMDLLYGGITGWQQLTNMITDISTLQKAGTQLRIYTLDDCWKLIHNQL